MLNLHARRFDPHPLPNRRGFSWEYFNAFAENSRSARVRGLGKAHEWIFRRSCINSTASMFGRTTASGVASMSTAHGRMRLSRTCYPAFLPNKDISRNCLLRPKTGAFLKAARMVCVCWRASLSMSLSSLRINPNASMLLSSRSAILIHHGIPVSFISGAF